MENIDCRLTMIQCFAKHDDICIADKILQDTLFNATSIFKQHVYFQFTSLSIVWRRLLLLAVRCRCRVLLLTVLWRCHVLLVAVLILTVLCLTTVSNISNRCLLVWLNDDPWTAFAFLHTDTYKCDYHTDCKKTANDNPNNSTH